MTQEEIEENNFVNVEEGHVTDEEELIEGVEDNDPIVDGFNQAWKNFDIEDMRLALDIMKTLAFALVPVEPLVIVLQRVLNSKSMT